MSLLKSFRSLALLAILSVVFVGCAGSNSGGSSGEGGYSEGGSSEGSSGGTDANGEPIPERKVSKDELKEAQTEAVATEEENHELRRQIFEAKNKLGIPVEQPTE